MKDKDIERIIRFKLAPINISVQTTNPELRCKMLHNRFAGEALQKIDRLYEADIPMNGQIVLCRGILIQVFRLICVHLYAIQIFFLPVIIHLSGKFLRIRLILAMPGAFLLHRSQNCFHKITSA